MTALRGTLMRMPPPLRRLLPAVCVAMLLACAGSALAHATLVFGTLRTDPLAADPVQGFDLYLHMMDPTRNAIEDAIVAAEWSPWPEDLDEHPEDAPWTSFALQETGPGGNYAARVELPAAGRWRLIMRDTTYPQEDAVAELIVILDGATEHAELMFIFPPTDIGAASLGTWLLWLVALPLGVGLVVTVAVLAGGRKQEPGGDAAGA